MLLAISNLTLFPKFFFVVFTKISNLFVFVEEYQESEKKGLNSKEVIT